MVFDIIARTNGAEGSFRAVGREAGAAGASIDRLGKAAFGMTAIFAAFAVNAAAKFESSMTRISTQAGVPIKDIKALGDSLLQLSPKVGFNPDDLATSLYHVESAFRTTGITAGKAIDVVKYASELAKIGNANLEDTTQAIIGTLSSKIKGVKDAADAAAQLNQLVGTGDTTLQAVVKAIGTGILPTAQALGLSFKDISAGLSTLSDNATPIDEAATRFRTTLSLIENPSAKATAALSSIGLSTVSLAEDFRKPDGLLVAMEDLQTHLNATYPLTKTTALSTDQIAAATKNYTGQLLAQGVQAKVATDLGNKYAKSLKEGGSAATLQAQTILSAFGGAKTGSTFLTLYGELDRLKSKYADTGTAAQAAGKFQQAWANQQGTAKQKLDELKASWNVFLIQVGNEILPSLKKVLDVLTKHPAILKDVAVGVGVMAAAWTAWKIGSFISNVITLTARLGAMALSIAGVGTAAAAATPAVAALDAAEAVNLGGAGAAGGAGVAGKAALGGTAVRGGEALGAGAAAASVAGPLAVAAAALYAGITLGQNYIDKHDTSPFNGKALDVLGAKPSVVNSTLSGNPQNAEDVNAVFKVLGSDAANSFGFSLALGLKPDQAFAPFAKYEKIPQLFTASGKIAAGAFIEPLKAIRADTAVIADFQNTVAHASGILDTNTKTLIGNSDAAVTNRGAIAYMVKQAKEAATSAEHLTGKQSDYTASVRLAIPMIENAATALGFNKQQVDALIHSLGLVPPTKTTKVTVAGADTAVINLQAIKEALDRIPFQKRVDITVATAPGADALVHLATQGGGHGFTFADGGINLRGRPGGIVQWAEAGGESFIPLSPSKRQRSLSLWQETGKLLGVSSMANGGIRGGSAGHSGPLVNVENMIVRDPVDIQEIGQQVGAQFRASMTARRV